MDWGVGVLVVVEDSPEEMRNKFKVRRRCGGGLFLWDAVGDWFGLGAKFYERAAIHTCI